jgi:small-conductance mechanosensitive channel
MLFSLGRGKVAYLKSLKRTFQLKQNSTLISSQVTNWTFSDRLRAITAQIQVPRNVDQRAAAELLRQAASETSGVVKNPAPQAYITALSSNTLILDRSVRRLDENPK